MSNPTMARFGRMSSATGTMRNTPMGMVCNEASRGCTQGISRAAIRRNRSIQSCMRWVSRKPKRSRQVDACGRIGGSGVERGSLGHQTRRGAMLGSFVLVVELNYESHASSVGIGVISGDEGPPRSSLDNSVEEMGVLWRVEYTSAHWVPFRMISVSSGLDV